VLSRGGLPPAAPPALRHSTLKGSIVLPRLAVSGHVMPVQPPLVLTNGDFLLGCNYGHGLDIALYSVALRHA
jgi:hypothetical protein